mmetsp:Transcript_7156/g.15532  ORF Transcript_7156/g.15532 Transcript_7156/m.15532 type:complete len:262 (-) Transcript_7156:157-942(-)
MSLAMDDDAPLATLAKAPKVDDDAPLASLAEVRRAPRTSLGSKASPAQAKAKAKSAAKRKKDGSSSSSSSSDSSSSSEEQGSKRIKRNLSKRFSEDGETSRGKKVRSVKEEAVATLLCRWWYALPDWPPMDDAFYEAELKKRSLRKVKIQEWEWVPEIDDKGRKKVYELSQFKGLFRDSSGVLTDLRPAETCPCYENLMQKDLPELYGLIVTAIENQLQQLTTMSKYNEDKLVSELKAKLAHYRNKAQEANQIVGAKRRNS